MCESEQIRSDRSASQTVRNRWKREQEERKSNGMILEKKKSECERRRERVRTMEEKTGR